MKRIRNLSLQQGINTGKQMQFYNMNLKYIILFLLFSTKNKLWTF